MSLTGWWMLGIDPQDDGWEEVEPGGDPGVGGGKLASWIMRMLMGQEYGAQGRHRFAGRFTRADIELPAEVDEAQERRSEPARKKILEPEWAMYQDALYERLSTISPAHIYNLRRHSRNRERYMKYTGTRAVQVAIGERRKPAPEGQAGVQGVYHTNAVDEVTQWQVVGAVAAISQAFLGPVVQAILHQFPFYIHGFHSDNGLVECKNGAVLRKHMGYGPIAQTDADNIDAFYQRSFHPYLNFHRPCGQPERRHALANLAPTRTCRGPGPRLSQTRIQRRQLEQDRTSPQRYRSRPKNAKSHFTRQERRSA